MIEYRVQMEKLQKLKKDYELITSNITGKILNPIDLLNYQSFLK
jgi:hypothetical protein